MKNLENTRNDKDTEDFSGMRNDKAMRNYEDMGYPGGIKNFEMRKTGTADVYAEDAGDVFEVIEGGKSEIKKDAAKQEEACGIGNAVGQYLKEIGSAPLLTAQEERELGRQIAVGIKAADDLADKEMSEMFGLREREELGRLVRDGKAAQAYLEEANLRLVVSVAKRFRGCGMEFEDLIQHGNIGLIRAAEMFDYKQGCRFSTYASWWIREEILRAITNTSHMIRIPVYLTKEINKMNRVTQELQKELGRDPSAKEIAEKTGAKPERIEMLSGLMQIPDSLDREVGENGESALGDLIIDERAKDPADVVTNEIMDSTLKQRLYEGIDLLEEREQTVLRLRYGLDGKEPQTLASIGEQIGVSRERVRQIDKQARGKLRRFMSRETA